RHALADAIPVGEDPPRIPVAVHLVREADGDRVGKALYSIGPRPDISIIVAVDDVGQAVGRLDTAERRDLRLTPVIPRLPGNERQHSPRCHAVDSAGVELVHSPALRELIHRRLLAGFPDESVKLSEIVWATICHDADEFLSR